MANRLSKSVFSKALAILLCFAICFTFIPFMDSEGAVANASAASTIELGDYVQMGTYDGEPIIWRCVAFYKVDTAGNVDLNSTKKEYEDGYLPLMLSDKILCFKAFDASGDVTENDSSHGRGETYYNTKGYMRQQKGSNCWEDSNLRCWLNSTADAGKVEWTCGNKPDAKHVWGGYNAYDQEAGFLSDNNFTEYERCCMKIVTQDQLIQYDEYSDEEMSAYGTDSFVSGTHKYKFCEGSINSIKNAYKKPVEDTMFLLDANQVNEIDNNKDLLCAEGYKGPYIKAIWPGTGNYNAYWFRSPCCNSFGSSVCCLIQNNDWDNLAWDHYWETNSNSAYYSMGVRPAFFMDVTAAAFVSGDGKAGTPYKLVNVTIPAVKSKTDANIIINEVTYPEGKAAEYAISESSTAPTEGWQDAAEFNNLKPDTKYYIFIRDKETKTLEIKILEVTTNKKAAPTVSLRTLTSITLNAIDGFEYRCGETDEWQDSNTFTGLKAGESYSFYQREKGKTNANEVSAPLVVNTLTYEDVITSGFGITAIMSGLAAISANRVLNKWFMKSNGVFGKKVISWFSILFK